MINDNETPEIGGELDLGGWSVEQAFNARKWLEQAITNAGAKTTDAGLGLGGVDVGFILDGVGFHLHMQPRIK